MNVDISALLKSKLSSFGVEFYDVNGSLGIITSPEKVLEVAGILKSDSELEFDSLRDAVSVDRFQKKNRFEVIYNLYSLKHKYRIFLKVILDTDSPKTPSLAFLWKAADWYEREAYDMMGIIFENHPDLRRIYMPEEFEHYPLKKDFPLMGIPGSLYLPEK